MLKKGCIAVIVLLVIAAFTIGSTGLASGTDKNGGKAVVVKPGMSGGVSVKAGGQEILGFKSMKYTMVMADFHGQGGAPEKNFSYLAQKAGNAHFGMAVASDSPGGPMTGMIIVLAAGSDKPQEFPFQLNRSAECGDMSKFGATLAFAGNNASPNGPFTLISPAESVAGNAFFTISSNLIAANNMAIADNMTGAVASEQYDNTILPGGASWDQAQGVRTKYFAEHRPEVEGPRE